MTKGPCKFHLLQGACSCPVVCSTPLFLPCSLQGYRLRCLRPGRNAAWPQRAAASASLSRTWAAAMMHCRSGTLQTSINVRRMGKGARRTFYTISAKPDRARRAHAAMVGTARNPSSCAPVGGHGSRRMRPSALPSPFETPAAKPLPAPHRVGESVARSSYGRIPLELNGRVGKGALCAPCPPSATDRVGTARAVKLASRNNSARAVAVGTLIAERPPHRSGHEAFPLTAPTSGPNASSNTR